MESQPILDPMQMKQILAKKSDKGKAKTDENNKENSEKAKADETNKENSTKYGTKNSCSAHTSCLTNPEIQPQPRQRNQDGHCQHTTSAI